MNAIDRPKRVGKITIGRVSKRGQHEQSLLSKDAMRQNLGHRQRHAPDQEGVEG